MRYRAYTVNVEEGELFPSLMEALSYIYEEIESRFDILDIREKRNGNIKN